MNAADVLVALGSRLSARGNPIRGSRSLIAAAITGVLAVAVSGCGFGLRFGQFQSPANTLHRSPEH